MLNQILSLIKFTKKMYQIYFRKFVVVGIISSVIQCSTFSYQKKEENIMNEINNFKSSSLTVYGKVHDYFTFLDADLIDYHDTCYYRIPENDKINKLVDLKKDRFNKDLKGFSDSITYSKQYFGKETYQQLKYFLDDLDNIKDESLSCSKQAQLKLSEPVWSKRKIKLLGMMQKSLDEIKKIENENEYNKYIKITTKQSDLKKI